MKKLLFHVSCIVYILVMSMLLFRRGSMGDEMTLSEYMRYGVNLTPFSTIELYMRNLSNGNITDIAMKNLVGNVLLFVPIGMYLPYYCKRLTSIWKFSVATILIIFTVEMVQLLSMRGRFDIDDLILNTCGALVGYIIWRIGFYKKI